MTPGKKRFLKLYWMVAAAIIFWTIGSGSYRDLFATSQETYKGLKLFSDVIELVEKNYVDAVDTGQLIQKAIQGMVRSLDPAGRRCVRSKSISLPENQVEKASFKASHQPSRLSATVWVGSRSPDWR